MPAGKSSPRKDKALEERFERLAQTWDDAVGHHSSHAIRTNHPAYREIIALGGDSGAFAPSRPGEQTASLVRGVSQHHRR
jgi:hypothetical protein